jgi:hypothetical protein
MKKCLILLFAAALIVTSVMPAMAQSKVTKDYPGKEMFDKPWPVVSGPITLRQRFLEGGKMDVERFINSGQGEALINSYKLQAKYKTGMEPEVIKYWDDKGIKKVDQNADPRTRWIAYVPKEALEKNNTKKFPLIFNMPHDDLFSAEGRGYAELAAKERLIVVIPSATDLEDILALYTKVVKMYPVDTSRFYMSGFSFTGFRTQEFTFRHPEVLAAIAFDCHLWPFMWQKPEKWIVDNLAKQKMPMIMYVGNADFGIPLPLNVGMYDDKTRMGADQMHTPQDNIDRANMWFRINGVREITYDESFAMAKSTNKVEREIGAPVSRSKIAKIDDTEYYFGDFVSKDGVYRTRFISMDNIPHFVFGSMAEVTWEFLKHFSRDLKTGESKVDGKLPL